MKPETSDSEGHSDRGSSYWKVNDSILYRNKKYIETEIQLFCAQYPDQYEALKCHIRDVLQALAINDSRININLMFEYIQEEKLIRETKGPLSAPSVMRYDE